MSVSLKQFVQQLTTIGLISADELRPLIDRLGQERDAKAAERLARELIREKKLTAFQAQAALQGKAKNLVLGNYLILEKLGQGGMGMVLKARHKRMDRVVALKILSAKALQSPDAVKRFEREVQAAAKLNHPNIVTAHDADEAFGTHFLVMEYVAGRNLSAAVKEQGAFPIERAVECVLQTARGLEYAHGKGIVHRDIKPANLLLGPDGVVKILDMGLARLESVAGGESELTGTGQIMGTIDYMAPEQAVNTKDADQRADIYSLGITLWFLLTGRMAYDGDTLMAKLIAHREQPIPSLLASGRRDLAGPIGERLDRVFQKMVAKRPEDRYPSMTHLIADLLRCHDAKSSPPTISHVPNDDSKFGAFLRGVAGGAPPIVQTAARPAVATHLDETLVAGPSQGDTDPETNISLAVTALTWQQFRHQSKSWLQDWRVRVAAIGSVVGLSLLVAVLAVARPFGRPAQVVANNPAQHPPPRGNPPVISPGPPTPGNPIEADKRWIFSDWKPLFDGESQAGWSGDRELLSVENGVLVTAARSGTVIAPGGEYRDFVVDIDFRLANGGNSGLGILYAGKGLPAYSGIEVQMLDDQSYANFTPDQRCGSLYSLAAPQGGRFRRWPEWNSLRVTALGGDLKVRLNDVEVVSATRSELVRAHPQHEGPARMSGKICLAPHTGRCEYRNFYIREATWGTPPAQNGSNPPALERAAAYNGHSYKYFAEQLPWKEAKLKCEALGGHLVIIEFPAENQFVSGLIGKAGGLDAWIGITDETQEGQWRTVAGQQQIYTNWSSGQPNDQGLGEDFALISNRTLGVTVMRWTWADQQNTSGTFSPGYVCEWDELPMSGGR